MSTKAIIWGIITAIVFIVLSALIKDTAAIWIQTRIFGLLSYLFLFLTVLIGELRVLTKIKANFMLFRFHKPFAIFALYLVFLHGISAVADNYKWGKGLSFTSYLGFTFSDHWLVLLSLGTLAFYLMILVSITTATKAIQTIGYKNWKRIHYLSYFAFIIAFVHSYDLGTDVKTSFIAPVVKPFVLLSFLLVISLFVTRMLHGIMHFSDQWDINLAGTFFIILIIGGVLFSIQITDADQQDTELRQKISLLESQTNTLTDELTIQTQENQQLQEELTRLTNG